MQTSMYIFTHSHHHNNCCNTPTHTPATTHDNSPYASQIFCTLDHSTAASAGKARKKFVVVGAGYTSFAHHKCCCCRGRFWYLFVGAHTHTHIHTWTHTHAHEDTHPLRLFCPRTHTHTHALSHARTHMQGHTQPRSRVHMCVYT